MSDNNNNPKNNNRPSGRKPQTSQNKPQNKGKKNKGSAIMYGINDTTEEVPVHLVFGTAHADGSGLCLRETDAVLPANNSAVIAHYDFDFAPGVIPFAELYRDGILTARRRWVDKPYHTLGLRPSDIRVTYSDGCATYCSDRFVFGVCLDLNGEDGGLSDNFFDLYPGRPYTVRLGKQSGEILYAYMGTPQEE